MVMTVLVLPQELEDNQPIAPEACTCHTPSTP